VFIASQGGIVSLISNIGDSRSYGVEASTTLRVSREFTLAASGGYLNAKWKNGVAFGPSINGNVIPNAPGLTGTFSADYSKPISSKLRINANVDANYTSGFWWDLLNTPGQEPGYWMANARVGIGAENGAWELSFRVTNLLGAQYWTEYYPNLFGGGPPYPACVGCDNVGSIGAPREYMVSLSVKY
jgi:iron complex outermembrane receptor protein